ncbi:MAG: hypothetical protein ACE5G1_14405 [bacterium]
MEGSYTPPFNFRKKYNHVLELDARFSFYDPDNGDDLATSVQQTTVTLGFQYFFHPRARFTFNYEFRDVDWDDNVKDRVMTQMTLIF